ncbi:nucleotidyl transferase AbiEii/AbiGii toxin family protein [Pectobacteriaceae bacterium CE70]|uniref:Nucleotidyl transferase AbiEii/AbiGii toxin family protein n=2 Tax=Gammaproteobacteria TaxID=1236 RepID=A0A2I5TE73_SERS3|nr:nucleotidyl transferase AbiEii/AbiGii toxin family protein [Serratia sp. ATCC 39006]WJV62784.1 nucleotidyl transferase AbiEii/AbiGii toxin family protein [Pectobacteriaceae bacterium C52]WJV67119.1 nucleotidyl transferase AbiEii/AbiGii toxin family protein [Pectobacteriaceae bacterium CE70]WJY11103.1 nucleotidyl transferase AbiEii/AbiGii toxin family protein [Pectobacteriaceae bacterium C80]AUG98545.1 nucleotidyl transferase AbiEii/AbiGii toxin family protein [Serratia sp. ATCC 39006]AUH028
MLKQQIRQIVQSNPDYAAVTPVIEKEILHHDIMDVLIKQGVMQRLTFIGGTSLRMCYNSSRLSEDLDFNGGHDFKPSEFEGLESEIQTYIQNKYETEVWVNKPSGEQQGDTVSWKISIVKEPNRPDLPRQKMHIDVCAIPSFDIEKRPLINHYDIVVPTEGILVPVQSLQETLADKLIALAYRARRIKPRDIWDIVWIKQRGIDLSKILVEKKLNARHKQTDDFRQALSTSLAKLMSEEEVHNDFNMEMSRFIPKQIKERTLDNPEYWAYVQGEVKAIAFELLHDCTPKNPFDMG